MYFPALDPTSNHLLDLLVREWVAPIGTNKTEFSWNEKAAGILNIKASTGLHMRFMKSEGEDRAVHE